MGDTAQSTVSLQLDRSMNNVSIRCEAENGALDYPLIATKTLHVLCKDLTRETCYVQFVVPPKRVIIRQPEQDPQMIAGQTTRLTCNVPSSNPAAEVIWEFDSGNSNAPIIRKGQFLYNRT